MNRLNFEKMDKKKLESIDDVLYTVTEGRIVRRRKNPLSRCRTGDLELDGFLYVRA